MLGATPKARKGAPAKLGSVKEAPPAVAPAGNKVPAEEVWEVRPGGMLVQKRRTPEEDVAAVEYILVRVATGWQWHDVSIDATATFGTSPRPALPFFFNGNCGAGC